MFQLTKWYLDLVTNSGDVLVGYSVECRLGAAGFRYASLLHAPLDAAAAERTTLRGARAPALDGNRLRWHVPRLRLDGAWEEVGRPLQQTLLDGPQGRIDWHCHFPRARVTARFEDSILAGMGYAEQLRVTCPPWELPFRSLRWGRHLSDEHEVVWIEWGQGFDRRWIWLDGREEPGAQLETRGISGLSGGHTLQFEDRRVVRDRRVLETVGRMLPGLLQERLGPLAGMRERKWLTRSALRRQDTILDRGWTLHEEVDW
jgi:hypothetical protein